MFASSRLSPIAMLAGLALATPALAGPTHVYSGGHGDVNIAYENGALVLNLEFGKNTIIDGSPLPAAQDFDADDVTTLITDANGLTTGPAGLPSPYGGAPIWRLYQTSGIPLSSRPFLGIGAEGIDPGLFQNDTLILTLTAIAARPAGGDVVLWQTGSESTPLFDSAAGGPGPFGSLNVAAGGHDHYNYGFTRAGLYDLVLTASGILADGVTRVSATETYHFQVGPLPALIVAAPEPASLGLAATAAFLGLAGLVATRRRPATTA